MLEEAVFWHVVLPVVININPLLAITLPLNYLLNYINYFKWPAENSTASFRRPNCWLNICKMGGRHQLFYGK
jgi:hypothetical protein